MVSVAVNKAAPGLGEIFKLALGTEEMFTTYEEAAPSVVSCLLGRSSELRHTSV